MERRDDDPASSPILLRCSFCNKSQRHVRKLIAGPAVHICDECVDICVDILAEERKDAPALPAMPEEATPPGSVPYPTRSATLIVTTCSLCHLSVPLEHVLSVHSRGLLCPGCLGAIQAAMAAKEEAEK